MRFFVDSSRRLVRTHDAGTGYPFSSDNWTEVTSAQYDDFIAQTREKFTAKQLKILRAEGRRICQVKLVEGPVGWLLVKATEPGAYGPFKTQRLARQYAAENKMMLVKP